MPDANGLDETIQHSQEGQCRAELTPDHIGRFRVERRLGSGAFGDVFLGYDPRLDRKVAIKLPRGDYSEELIQSFLAEARRLAQLQHPGIVAVYDVGRDGNRCYIVTEYLQGGLLQDQIERGRLDWHTSIEIVTHLAEALGHAHSRGIMHRDIKPSNIMVTSEGRYVLIDFGLGVNELQTNRGDVVGTPAYMSPEQVRGEAHRIDGRTDIYALGGVLYELLTGRRPFRARDVKELFLKILHDAPQPIRQLNPDVPPKIDEICMQALEKELHKRFTTAGDFAEALRQAADLKAASVAGAKPAESLSQISTPESPQTEVGSTSRQGVESLSQSRRLREAERRLVTLLGISFDVSQRLANVEMQHACAERFIVRVEAIAAEFGGRLCLASGSEIDICFGFPVSYEDSVSRAVRCGLEVFKQVDQDPNLPQNGEIFVAVHSGLAVAEESKQGVKVTGDVSQTLRRLLTVVDAASVIITENAYKLSRLYFELESLGEAKARGLAKPITIYRVVRELPVTMNRVELVDPGNLTPLIGRDTELSILRDRWEQASEGMGQIVLLIGEAGLGKSRLIREIREHVASDDDAPDIVELRCSQHHQSAGLYPLIEHLTQLLRLDECAGDEGRVVAIERYLENLQLRTDQNVALLGSMLSVAPQFAPPLELPPQRLREYMTQLTLDILRQRSERRQILFIVEDLHWADPTLLELLSAYVEAFDQHRALSVFTFRPEFETPWRSKPHQTQIALNRLTRRQIRDMLRKRLDRTDISDSIVDQIVDRTDGIPLFIEEFSMVIAESGSLDGGAVSDERLTQIIPTSLQDLLMARLDRLESDWEVVQMAAAIGREFSFALLAAASELPVEQLESELGKLVAAEILFQKGRFPEATFIFKHALIQDSAYNSMLTNRRQQMHSRIAAALEHRFPEITHRQPGLLAHHYTEAAQEKKGIDYWLKAGVKAQTMSANVEAISHLRRGLDLLQTLESSLERDQWELKFQATLGPILMAARGWSAPEVGIAIERARQLCARVGTVADQFFMLWGLWGWRVIRGDMEICQGIADEMMQLVQNVEPSSGLLAEAHWAVGCTAYYKGDLQTGLQLLEKGLSLVDREQERLAALKTGQCCGMACGVHIALALWQLGFPDQALRRAEEALFRTKQLGHSFSYAMALFVTRVVLQCCGREEQARAQIEMEYDVCHEQGFVFFEVHAIFARGAVLIRNGQIDEARRLLDLGLAMRLATGGNLSMEYPYRDIAESFLLAGRYDDANAWLERGFDLVDNHQQRGLESEFMRLKGELAVAAGDLVGAETFYQQALEIARRQQARSWELRTTISLVALLRRQGKQTEARALLTAAYSNMSEGFDTADLVRARALLAEIE